MGKQKLFAPFTGLIFAAIAATASGQPAISELSDGSVSVRTGNCTVRFTAQGRVLDYGEGCEREQIGEATAAFRQQRLRDEAPPQAVPNPPGGRGLQITSVAYGADDRSCDATRVFERQCRGQGSCEVQVDNSLCGDPAGGRQKFALIQYACNGQPQQKLVEEGNVARLECSGGSPRLPTAPPAAPPVAPPASSPTIRIEDARYGAGNRTCEANLAFARACNGQWSCEVPVDNELCGDPARGDRKSVEVEYRCGDRSLTAVVDEGDTARLACDAEPARPGRPDRYGRNLRIEDVTYGARNGTCDASLAFARACNGERACEITIDNSLCGDPARNTRKSVDIEYRCGDRPLRFSADEGATVRLDCSGGRIVSGGSTRSRTVDIRMDDVVYGFGGRTCNATLAFARQCNGEPTCAVQIDNELCGDPAPNTRKRADIEYRCGDRRRTLSVDEGATAELDCL